MSHATGRPPHGIASSLVSTSVFCASQHSAHSPNNTDNTTDIVYRGRQMNKVDLKQDLGSSIGFPKEQCAACYTADKHTGYQISKNNEKQSRLPPPIHVHWVIVKGEHQH